jgi:hypothetical protein
VTEEIILLKEALQKRTGIALDSVLGCKRLDAWLKLRGVFISYSTLSRIFGLATLNTTPRERTLDELASVLGYSNFNDFKTLGTFKNSETLVSFDLQFAFERALSEGKLNKASSLYLQMVETSFTSKIFSKDLAKALFENISDNKKALSQLASSKEGRESFFLTFIDEDDLTGNYRKALNEFFLPNSSSSEKQFVQLYALRKDILAQEQSAVKGDLSFEVDSFSNIHLRARALELKLLKVKSKRINQRGIEVGHLAEEAFQLFCESLSRNEELAVLGRFARGVLYIGASNYLSEHKNLIKAMQSLLNQPVEDFEFKIPIYALLNQLNKSHELTIPQASSWPNAYYSSAVFLLNKEQRKRHEMFFQSTLGVHKTFLYAYE